MAKGYGHMWPGVERTFHNSKWMEVIDPFGNRLRFDESLDEPKASSRKFDIIGQLRALQSVGRSDREPNHEHEQDHREDRRSHD